MHSTCGGSRRKTYDYVTGRGNTHDYRIVVEKLTTIYWSWNILRPGGYRRRTYDCLIVVEELTTMAMVVEKFTTIWFVFMSTLNPCRLKSDEKTLADSLDYEKIETKKLREEKEDLLKKFQEANSAAQKLQEEKKW